MTLRVKIILVVGLTMTAVISLASVLFSEIVMAGFIRTEETSTLSLVARVHRIIESKFQYLDSKASDWANWDDSYRFVADRNQTYVDTNLGPESVANLGLFAILLFDHKGDLAGGTAIDAVTHEAVELPPEVMASLAPGSELLSHDDPRQSKRGFLVGGPERMMIVTRAIVHSDGQGPSNGTLVFLARLDESEVRSWSQLADAAMTLARVDDPLMEPDMASARDRLSGPGPALAAALDSGTVAGYTVLSDVFGRPAMILRASTTRSAYYNGLVSQRYLTGSLVGIGLVFAVCMLLVIDQLVLRRLGRVSQQLGAIGDGNDPALRVRLNGRDELAGLATSINGMLDALAQRAEQARRFTADLIQSRDEQQRQARELAAKAAELEQARAAADAASRAKSDFLANMSHEIRTPMTAILGFADLLVEPDQSVGERNDCVQIIRRSGEHLLALINDILDLSKIESGHMTVERIACSPAQVIADAVSLMRVRASEKGLSLNVRYEGLVPEKVLTDPMRVRQVLVNLIGNAIKFTDRGGVTVGARLAPGTEMLAVTVTDTGIGMTPEQAARLFRPFAQADSSMSRRYGGTGLGLSISRRLATMLGGDVTLTSAAGEGTSVTATIATGPLSGVRLIEITSEGLAPEPTTHREAPKIRLDGRVLLAEDGTDNQRLICFHLRKAGAEVEVAENGRIAVEMALAAARAGRPFGVIIMDMQMPELDGYGAAAELRAVGYGGPIVALTAHAMTGDRERCMDAGCDSYATKPIDRIKLLQVCAEHLNAATAA
jgi:signal transduction histidine kinase